MNLGRIAFVTAILLAVVRIHSLFDQVRALRAGFRWLYVPAVAANFLFVLPFLALLFILNGSRVQLSISRGRKRIALGAACVYGLLFVAPALYALFLMVRQDLQGVSQTPNLANQVWAALGSLSEFAFCLFLVALFFQKDQLQTDTSSSLRETAALAAITAALVVVLSLGGMVYGAVELRKQASIQYVGDSVGKLLARSLISMIPRICELIAAYIIFKSQPRMPEEASQAADVLPHLPVANT